MVEKQPRDAAFRSVAKKQLQNRTARELLCCPDLSHHPGQERDAHPYAAIATESSSAWNLGQARVIGGNWVAHLLVGHKGGWLLF